MTARGHDQSGLIAFLDSVKARDPAARSRWDVLFYPGVLALALHRVGHWLWEGRLFFLARLVNHLARFLTAIDIHPGAKITSAVGSAKMSGTMAEVPLLERRSLPQRAKARQVAGLGQCDAVAGNRATQHLNWER